MLRPQPQPPIHDATARIARAAFLKGHPYFGLAEQLGGLFTDELFAALFPHRGQPALAPWRLALITILQFAEGMSDVQAADAVRSRIDWKYLLRLDLTDAGFDASVLCEFRGRLIAGEAEDLLLDTLLTWCRERAGCSRRVGQTAHRLDPGARGGAGAESAGGGRRDVCATPWIAWRRGAPEWLAHEAPPDWAERYARRIEDDRLPKPRQAARTRTGADDRRRMARSPCSRRSTPPRVPGWLRELPAVETLRQVWVQQYQRVDGAIRWRGSEDIPPGAIFISSPHDADAHFARKRDHPVGRVQDPCHRDACDRELPQPDRSTSRPPPPRPPMLW